jgi:hypothetical protein
VAAKPGLAEFDLTLGQTLQLGSELKGESELKKSLNDKQQQRY